MNINSDLGSDRAMDQDMIFGGREDIDIPMALDGITGYLN